MLLLARDGNLCVLIFKIMNYCAYFMINYIAQRAYKLAPRHLEMQKSPDKREVTLSRASLVRQTEFFDRRIGSTRIN